MAKIKINSELFKYAVSTGTKLNFNLLTSTDTSARSSPFFNQMIEDKMQQKEFEQLIKTLEIQDKFPKRMPYIIYVTFPQRYRAEKHHLIPEAHPDGWVEIHCNSARETGMIKARFLGRAYAHMCQASQFKDDVKELYPLGCTRVLTMKDLLDPISLTDHLE